MASFITYEYEGKKYLKVKVKKRDKNGKQRAKTGVFTKSGKRISTQNIASQVASELLQQLEYELNLSVGYTWKTWHQEALKQIKRQYLHGTSESYDSRLLKWVDPEWNDKDLGSFSNADIHSLIFKYIPEKGGKEWTQKNICKKVHRVFEMAVEKGLLARNPAKGIKVYVPEFTATALRDDEMVKLFNEGRRRNHPMYPHWIAAGITGMRNGELYILSWDNINLKHNLIEVNLQFTKKDGIHLPKKKRVRTIELNPMLKKFLLEFREKHGTFKEEMWQWGQWRKARAGEVIGKKVYHGGEMVRDKIPVIRDNLVLPRLNEWKNGMQAEVLRRFCVSIGITSVKFHDLRASFITNLLENGTGISKVMKQVGHSKMATTDQYNRLSVVNVRGATERTSFEIPDEEVPDNVVSIFGA